MQENPKKHKNFSLIEMFVLLVMFGLLAAVVVPRFPEASSETELSDMVNKLQIMRSQIELYRIQHNDLYPGQQTAGGRIDPQSFVIDLVEKDPVDGYGPYLKEIPVNPFAEGTGGEKIVFVNDKNAKVKVKAGYGWWFNAATGEFRACTKAEHTRY